MPRRSGWSNEPIRPLEGRQEITLQHRTIVGPLDAGSQFLCDNGAEIGEGRETVLKTLELVIRGVLAGRGDVEMRIKNEFR
jgi:hypothetical protein